MDYREKAEKSWEQFKKRRGLGEAISLADSVDYQRPVPQHGDKWGDWEYDAKYHVLALDDADGNHYEINILDFGTSAGVLDWIFQVAGKTWVKPVQLGNLIKAIDDLVEPQANLCSGGHSKTLDVKTFLKRIGKSAGA
ncbi:MAG: hypothetical protein WBC67_02280 [Candidatus Acidiferrales bacterium]